jgi:hypothetical protein
MDNSYTGKTLFDNVTYTNEDDFIVAIKNMPDETKKDIIRRIIEYSYSKNIYTIPESEFISILLRYL